MAAASAGCYGARQYVSPVRSVLSRAEHDEALLYDRSAYQEMRGRGINIRYPHLLTFDLGTTFSTALCAFDNTRGAPPWYPLGRRQDNAFRRLAGICDENAVFATLPTAARHEPAYKPPFSGEALWEIPIDLGVYNELILAQLAETLGPCGGSERLVELGSRYGEIAGLAVGTFRQYLLQLRDRYLSELARRLEDELAVYGAEPEWWAADISLYLEQIEAERSNPSSVVPRELELLTHEGERPQPDGAIPIMQSYYRRYGELLAAWPRIRQAACELNAAGIDDSVVGK